MITIPSSLAFICTICAEVCYGAKDLLAHELSHGHKPPRDVHGMLVVEDKREVRHG